MQRIINILILFIIATLLYTNSYSATTEINYGDKIGGKLVIRDGSAQVKVVDGSVTVTGIMIKNWTIEGTNTITIAPGQTRQFVIPAKSQSYYLSSISISGIGGDAKIKVILPSPHYSQIQRINPSSPNVIFNFGEGIKIDSGESIAIEILSTDLEVGLEVDISWQCAF